MNKCFFLNHEKKEQIRLVVFEKNAHFNSENDVTESRRLGYSNNQLNCKQRKSQFQASGNHGFRKRIEKVKYRSASSIN